MKIDNFTIGDPFNPYIIAEIGVNHAGNMDLAKAMIDQAAKGGAHAVKFQTYKADKLTIKNSPAYWDTNCEPTKTQYELFQKYDSFGQKEYELLAEYSQSLDVHFLSTPFDIDCIDWLDPLMPCYKVSSSDLTNFQLLEKICAKNKPIILSTGAAFFSELHHTIAFLEEQGIKDLALLHCVLNYPTRPKDAQLGVIQDLKEKFPNYTIGYSDHVTPDADLSALQCACSLGAVILEKHFTYNKTLPGNDHYHAMDGEDLLRFTQSLSLNRELRGQAKGKSLSGELKSRKNARRSLVATTPLAKNQTLSPNNIASKRPCVGISAHNYPEILGATIAQDITPETPLQWDMLAPRGPNGKRKVVGIIQARLGSSRLPRKAFRMLGGKPILQWVIDRVSLAENLHEVVVAIPEKDMELEAFIAQQTSRIKLFKGSEEDVLSRFAFAASQYNADTIVRICSDNPFICPKELDRLIDNFENSPQDYLFNHIPYGENLYPDGLGAEILSRELLEKLNIEALAPKDREHVTQTLFHGNFPVDQCHFPAPSDIAFPEIKLDIDTPSDLEKLKTILGQSALPPETTLCSREIIKHARSLLQHEKQAP
tara:strand:+ start:55840 stop:57627 length:1788 start_codon:yes stop_codon:yes gene_type:complete